VPGTPCQSGPPLTHGNIPLILMSRTCTMHTSLRVFLVPRKMCHRLLHSDHGSGVSMSVIGMHIMKSLACLVCERYLPLTCASELTM
jgi:hypothetical protein